MFAGVSFFAHRTCQTTVIPPPPPLTRIYAQQSFPHANPQKRIWCVQRSLKASLVVGRRAHRFADHFSTVTPVAEPAIRLIGPNTTKCVPGGSGGGMAVPRVRRPDDGRRAPGFPSPLRSLCPLPVCLAISPCTLPAPPPQLSFFALFTFAPHEPCPMSNVNADGVAGVVVRISRFPFPLIVCWRIPLGLLARNF